MTDLCCVGIIGEIWLRAGGVEGGLGPWWWC